MKRSTSRLYIAAATAAKSLQSCLTQCDPVDSSPPGSPIPGILQERTLEWVASSFSYAWKWKVRVKSLSHVWFLATPWTAAYQAPLSMGFSRQEYWSGVPLPSPERPYYLLFNIYSLPVEFSQLKQSKASTCTKQANRTEEVILNPIVQDRERDVS